MRKGYGQFCPVAKAAEVLGDRWNLLVLREMLYGNRYFNDISRGVDTCLGVKFGSEKKFGFRLRSISSYWR
jgi:DNA-binding HxlR family transcriptional regulator